MTTQMVIFQYLPLSFLHVFTSAPFNVDNINISEYIDCLLADLPALLWLSDYVKSDCLAVALQSGAKQIFYCTVDYITLK
jgi:hypothetical protein